MTELEYSHFACLEEYLIIVAKLYELKDTLTGKRNGDSNPEQGRAFHLISLSDPPVVEDF